MRIARTVASAILVVWLSGAVALAAGGSVRITREQADAARANKLSVSQCLAFCQRGGATAAQCAPGCRAGQCYRNPATGNAYCVD